MRFIALISQGILIVAFFSANINAQKQNNIWYFGAKAGLDFNSNPPKPITSDLEALEGTASISDPAGHLLFYTNGTTIWDRNHNPMPNGSGLLGGESSTQAALIIPAPGSCDKYYVFTTEDHYTNGGLTYCIVDMCLNDGNGDIPSNQKNILLQDATAEKITAILHPNGVDTWIVTHTLGSNRFFSFLVTASGINSPVISTIGANYPSDGHIGPIKASHDGRKIVSSVSFRNICEMFDFNKNTGIISNLVDLYPLLPTPVFIYGIEFSPNDSLLYLSTFYVTSRLMQINLDGLDIVTLNSKTGHYHYGMLQMGTDNKIYMARTGENFIDVIHQPNLKGAGCQYEEAGVTLLPNTFSQSGLPNFAPYSFSPDTTYKVSLPSDITLCNGKSFELKISKRENECIDGLLWSDGSQDSSFTISQQGTYWVEVRTSCQNYRDSIDVKVETCQLQTSCQQNYFSVLGSLIQNETGFCITSSPDQKSIYLGGLRGDSALVLKIDPSGQLDWTRSFSFVPGVPNQIYGIIVDSDGKVVISGFAGQQLDGGTVFIARYDADLNKILWAKRLTGASDNFNLGLIEMEAGGDYLVSNNPVSPNVAELIRIERLTGNTVNGFRKQYDLGSSETICDLIMVNGRLFGCGRFSDGGSVNEMRNTLLEFNPANGNILWMKLGHKPGNVAARLYGWDLVAADNDLFSIYSGDENSGSLSNTKIYVQRTGFNGQLKWIKEYDLPGNNDWVDELIESDNGLVIMARNRIAPSDLILFKIDYNGKFIWAKQYDYTNNDNGIAISGSMSQLISVDNHFFFTGFAEENGNSDLVLIKTDLEGNISDTCGATQSIIFPSRDLVNPLFYSKSPLVTNVTPTVQNLVISAGKATSITTHHVCGTVPMVESLIAQKICSGTTFEGYDQTGIYQDTFTSQDGCDSIRTLNLTVHPTAMIFFSQQICDGELFEGHSLPGLYQDTFQTVNGCDSIRVLSLTVRTVPVTQLDEHICAGDLFEGHALTGIYQDTFQTIDGCDSIRILHLTVLAAPVTLVDKQICSGDTFEGYSLTGMYQDTFQAVDGCDSIRVLHLMVQNILVTSLDKQICMGDFFEGYAATGTYQDTFQATGGCDSIRTLNLIVNTSISDAVSVFICHGENYYGHTVSGQFLDTIIAAQGCDTFRTINLSIIPSSYRYMEATICHGEQYLDHNANGVYFDTLFTNAGCDSVIELHLTVRDEINSFFTSSICDEMAKPFGNPGTYYDTLEAVNGCDSLIQIDITDEQVYIPNVFSPNDDGINDVFTVFTKNDEPLSIQYFGLFDRFGDMVYETQQWPIHWNGLDRNHKAFQPGVFTYVLHYDCGQHPVQLGGSVTLIK